MGTLPINILGSSFTIQASEDSEYLNKLLGYYERIATEIQKSGILRDPTQISIMTGIMICDELYKEKSKNAKLVSAGGDVSQAFSEENEEVERRTLDMISNLNKVL